MNRSQPSTKQRTIARISAAEALTCQSHHPKGPQFGYKLSVLLIQVQVRLCAKSLLNSNLKVSAKLNRYLPSSGRTHLYLVDTRPLVILLAVQDPQNRKEQVDDIEVQADCRSNLLLHMMVPDDHLGVDENVAAEDERRKTAVDEFACAAVGEEGSHESEQNESPEAAEKVGHPASEVVLGLARESGQEDKDTRGEENGIENDGGLVEGNDDGDGVGFEQSEA